MNRTITLATVLAVGLMLTACTDTDEPPIILPSATSPTFTPAPATSATPTSTPQQQVLDAYLGMQNGFLKASETANPDDPELPRHATGAALKLLKDGLIAMRDKGLRARGQTLFHPTVESLTPAAKPTRARIRDCMDTTKAEAYKASGDPYTDSPGGLRLVLADLERADNAWKVTGLGVREVGSCKL